jgi:tetratricopeptide (TPR) repeat protein
MGRQLGLGRLVVFFAALVPIHFLAVPVHAQDIGNIIGQIRMVDGNFPPERILVSLHGRGAIINSQYCDNDGKFGFYGLIANPYYIVIESEKYQPLRKQVILNPSVQQTMNLHVVLNPLPEKEARKSDLPFSGGNPHLVRPSDYEKQFPRAAIKAFEAGMKAEKKGKVDEAIRHYEEAIRLAPDFYPAHNNLGVKYLSRGRLKDASKHFAEVIRLVPTDAQAYFNLGNVLLIGKQYREAMETIRDGLKRQPNSAFGNFLLGSVAARAGSLAEAEQTLLLARELDPHMPEILLELANVYLLTGRKKDAVRELAVFVREFPKSPLTPKVKGAIEKLQEPSS